MKSVLLFVVSGGKLQTVKYDESRVWTRQAPNKRWLNVHLHRSVCPLTAGDGVQRAEKWQPVLSVWTVRKWLWPLKPRCCILSRVSV